MRHRVERSGRAEAEPVRALAGAIRTKLTSKAIARDTAQRIKRFSGPEGLSPNVDISTASLG
jgi:hypothetical protein